MQSVDRPSEGSVYYITRIKEVKNGIRTNDTKWGGTIVTEVELGTSSAYIDIVVGDYVYIDLTIPEPGYIPVGWCISSIKSMVGGRLMYLNGLFRLQSGGVWRFTIGNVGTQDCTRLWYTIKILWVKA